MVEYRHDRRLLKSLYMNRCNAGKVNNIWLRFDPRNQTCLITFIGRHLSANQERKAADHDHDEIREYLSLPKLITDVGSEIANLVVAYT